MKEGADADATPARASLVLAGVLRLFKPLARLLLRHGVHHRTFCVALKRVFLEAAQQELQSRGMAATDSALTLLSGVHRRDVRTLLREAPAAAAVLQRPASLATEVVARWLHERPFRQRGGRLRTLPRGSASGSFDRLVESVSRDVRPRALLDELVRLGVARETPDGVALVAESFTPRAGFAELTALFADNLQDHIAAAAENLDEGRNHLEQSVFVDQLTAASAARLQQVSVRAWKHAFQSVMDEAQRGFDDDATHAAPHERTERARFGVYFYGTSMDGASAGEQR